MSVMKDMYEENQFALEIGETGNDMSGPIVAYGDSLALSKPATSQDVSRGQSNTLDHHRPLKAIRQLYLTKPRPLIY